MSNKPLEVSATAASINNNWDYEAPQYCDFDALDTFQDDPESDQFFLKDHEKENSIATDYESDFFQTPMKSEDFANALKSNDDSMTEYLSLSSGQPANTPSNRKSEYALRPTLLREQCNSGMKPMKETRQSFHFGRKSRKSMSVKKVNGVSKVALESVENTMVVHRDEDGDVTLDKRGTYDLASISQAIDQINSTMETSALADVSIAKSKTDIFEALQVNENQPAAVVEATETIEDEPDAVVEVAQANDKPETHKITNKPKLEKLDMSNLMSEDEDDNQFKSAEVIAEEENLIISNQENLETSVRRSSYVVTSPIISKSSAHVHFNSSRVVVSSSGSINVDGNDSNTLNNNSNEASDVTPKTNSQSAAKIRNRQATPAVAASAAIPARFKKYIERLSKTPTSDSKTSEKGDSTQKSLTGPVSPSVSTKVPPVIGEKKPLANVAKKTVRMNVPEKTEPKKALIAPKRATVSGTVPVTSKPRPTFNRNSMKLPAVSRASSVVNKTNTTVVKEKVGYPRSSFHSMAEMQTTFLLRKFSPMKKPSVPLTPGKSKMNLTKPRAPKLLTEQRAQMYKTQRPLSSVAENVVDGGAAVAPKMVSTALSVRSIVRKMEKININSEAGHGGNKSTTQSGNKSTTQSGNKSTTQSGNKSTNQGVTTTSTVSKRRTSATRPPAITHLGKKIRKAPTKGMAPIFSTDIRLKQWNEKLKKVEEAKNKADVPVFKARPVPNFKRQPMANKSASSNATMKRDPIKMAPFSFEQREQEKAKRKAIASATTSSNIPNGRI